MTRTLYKLLSLSLLLMICLVLTLDPPAPIEQTVVDAPPPKEKEYDTIVERIWDKHQDAIIALLLGA